MTTPATTPGVRAVIPVALCALTLACASDPPPQPPKPADAEVVGFLRIERPADGPPRWVFDAKHLPEIRARGPGPWALRWGSEVVPHEAHPLPAGTLLRARSLPKGAGPLVVEAPGRRRSWSAGRANDGATDPVAAAVARGRAAYRKGDSATAEAAWIEAAQAAAAQGWPTVAAARWRAVAYVRLFRRDFQGARGALASATSDPADPRGQQRLRYLEGLLARETGATLEARRALDEALEAAEALGAERDGRSAGMALGAVLGALGQHDAALALFADRLEALHPPGHADRGHFAVSYGWALLTAMDAGRIPLDLPGVIRWFEEALATIPEGRVAARANVQVNLAWARLLQGRGPDASKLLGQAAPAVRASIAWPLAAWLGAEVTRRSADAPTAHRAFLALDATLAGEPLYAWRAPFGAALTAPDPATARAAFADALARLDRLVAAGGLRDDVAPMAGARSELLGAAHEALRVADPPAAFAVADRQHAYTLRATEARGRLARLNPQSRAEWARHRARFEQAGQALARLRGDADLVYRPEDRAARATKETRLRRTRAEAFDDAFAVLGRASPPPPVADGPTLVAAVPSGQALLRVAHLGGRRHTWWIQDGRAHHAFADQDLLAPWVERLGAITHLYVVPGNDDEALALPLRPLGAGPLAATHRLTFLPEAALLLRPPATAKGPPLVVADTRRDLPGARREGARVARALAVPGLHGDAATRVATLAGLDGARAFHFAGHGDLHGASPWDAHLRLAGEDRLALEDLLVTRPRVGVVVLSGCRTGARVRTGQERVGLPEAFLLSGARAVLATVRDVKDGEVISIVDRFVTASGFEQPAEAWRRTVAASEAAGDPSWRAFRLWGRP